MTTGLAHDALQMIDYGDGAPTALILADDDGARALSAEAARRAGFRVVGEARIGEALARLDSQIAVSAVALDVGGGHDGIVDRLLDRLEQAAQGGRHAGIVASPAAMIDFVAARTPHPRIQLLCMPSEADRALAFGLAAAAVPVARLSDVRRAPAPRLQQLSEEVGRIAGILARLSQTEGEFVLPAAGAVETGPPVEAAEVRAVIRARRLRDQYFAPDLFADPAWDMLLDLFAARLDRQRVAVSSLCIAAAVPPTTALRWIKSLTEQGLLERIADPHDGRRVFIQLADAAAAALTAYFVSARKVSPLLG